MARLTLKSPEEVLQQIASSARELRLQKNLTQAELGKRADVALRSLQRFENTGRSSTETLVRIAFALGVEDALDALFARPEPGSMDEFLDDEKPRRRRARGSK